MIPAAFEYSAPEGIPEAITLLQQYGDDAKVLAGGHSPDPDDEVPSRGTVAISWTSTASPGWSDIREEDGRCNRRADPREPTRPLRARARQRIRMLADTTRVIADPLVRNMATVGGNLAHADPANDHPAAMLAYGAQVVAVGPNGERVIPIEDFFEGLFQTSLAHDELLTEIRIPIPPPRSGGAYMKLERKVGDSPRRGRRATHSGRRTATARQAGIGLTNVGETPIKATKAEAALKGKPLRQQIPGPPHLAAEAAEPNDDQRGSEEYKRPCSRRSPSAPCARPLERATGGKSEGTHEHLMSKSPSTARSREADVEPRLLLVHFIREDLGLTGTHIGCDTTSCGACTVMLERPGRQVLHRLRRAGGRRRGDDRRGLARRHAAPHSGGLLGKARLAVRLLHAGHDDHRSRLARAQPEPQRRRDPLGHLGQSLPLHRVRQYRQGRAASGREDDETKRAEVATR